MKLLLAATLLVTAAAAGGVKPSGFPAVDDLGKILKAIEKQMLEGSFKARVEVTTNNTGEAKTNTVVEYHDADAGVHSLEIFPENVRQFYFSGLKERVFVSVQSNGSCKTMTESEASENPDLYFYQSVNPLSEAFFLGPTAEITLLKEESYNTTESYEGKVRGLRAVGYLFTAQTKKKPDVTLWFADKNWDSGVTNEDDVPFPIRITVAYEDANSSVSRLMEFFEVEKVPPKEKSKLGDKLQLPLATENCKLTLPTGVEGPPALDNMIYFTAEVKEGASATEYFSIEEGLYRADNADGSKIILDGHAGLQYRLDKNCSAKPNDITGDAVESAIVSRGSDKPGALAIRSYLTLRHTAYYIGETAVRDIPTVIWESTTPKGEFASARWYFANPAPSTDSKENVVFANAGDDPTTLVMVKAIIKMKQTGWTEDIREIHISDYHASDTTDDTSNIFNIEACVRKSQYFDLVFEADRNLDGEMFSEQGIIRMEAETKGAIVDTLQISPMQVAYTKAEIQEGTPFLQVYVKLLESPKYLASFNHDETPRKHPDTKAIDSSTDESCAQACIEQSKNCPTFLFCSKDKSCYVMNASEGWKEVAGSLEDCLVYNKSPNVTNVKRPTLEEMGSKLESDITTRVDEFNIAIPYSSDENGHNRETIQFKGYRLHAHLSQFHNDDDNGPYKLLASHKSFNTEADTKGYTLEVEGDILTKGDCYRECLHSTQLACASFSICTETKTCVLSVLNLHASHPSDEQKLLVTTASQTCSVYTMNYLDDFDKISGKVMKAGSKFKATVKSAGDCAVKCRQEGLGENHTDCHSFDYSPRTQQCFLYDFHYNYAGGNDALVDDNGWDHYALRYSASFTPSSRSRLGPKDHSQLIQGGSMEDCAKLCTEMPSNKCKSISYCDDGKVKSCYVYPMLAKDSKEEPDTICTLYQKDESLAKEVIKPERQGGKGGETTVVGMGDGAFAFLLIVMMAIGIAIGAASYIKRDNIMAIAGRRGASGGSAAATTISYNRQNDENSATIGA